MKNYLALGIILIVILAGGFYFFTQVKPAGDSGDQVACTMEAKQCSDGSYVGRQGPNCEFAPCPDGGDSNSPTPVIHCAGFAGRMCPSGLQCVDDPSDSCDPNHGGADCGGICIMSAASGMGTVVGAVTLGPTCPVMQNPPDPKCADKPYQTTISITNHLGSGVISIIESDASGRFSVGLPAGDYDLHAEGGNTLPRCQVAEALVTKGIATTVNISCDTGIR